MQTTAKGFHSFFLQSGWLSKVCCLEEEFRFSKARGLCPDVSQYFINMLQTDGYLFLKAPGKGNSQHA